MRSGGHDSRKAEELRDMVYMPTRWISGATAWKAFGDMIDTRERAYASGCPESMLGLPRVPWRARSAQNRSRNG